MATCSRPSVLRAAAGVALLAAVGGTAEARVFLTRAEALELAFPGCDLRRETHYLTEEQLRAARDQAGVEIRSAIAYSYRATCDGKEAGTAYFDSHRVRTLPETVMIVVDPESRVARIEVVEFSEPEEYIPSPRWYAQFPGRRLDRELRLKRAIRGMTGATLTARATTEAARRILAIHGALSSQAATPIAGKNR